MGFLDSWISGCNDTPNLLDAITIFLANLMNHLFVAVLDLVNDVLSVTVLSTAGSQSIVKTVTAIGTSLDGMALALMTVLLIWSVLTSGEDLMTTGRWDGLQGIAGRAGSAILWIAGSSLAVVLLVHVNSQLVTGIHITEIGKASNFADSCSDVVGKGVTSTTALLGLTAGAIGVAVFWELILQFLFLVLIVALIYVFWQWLSRLAEILFWGSLLPLAAATLVADSSRRTFDYVWRNVQGAIFTQAAMALGIYVIEKAVLFNGGAMTGVLNLLVSIAGFFLVGHIPQYFKEMHGHSSSGGFDAAKGASAILMARGMEAALGATPIGQFTGRALKSMQSTSDQQMRRSTSMVGRSWHKMGQNMTRGAATANFDQARYETTPGVTDLNYNADAMRETHFAAWQEDQDKRWGPDDYAPGTQSGFAPSGPGGSSGGSRPGGGGGRPGGFMPGGVFRSDGPRRGPSGSAGGAMPPGTVTVENFDSATKAWVPNAAIPLGSGPDATPLASQMPVPSHAVGDPVALRGNQQMTQRPNQTADAFVSENAEKMRNYLRHVVQPNTIAATSFQPEEQVAKVAELRQKYQRLGIGGPAATAVFAELSGVTVEQLERQDVRDRITQDLAAKQWGGSLQSADPDTLSLEHPLSNTGVQGVHIGDVARNFTAPPSAVSHHLKQMKDRARSKITGTPTPVERARNAGWNS